MSSTLDPNVLLPAPHTLAAHAFCGALPPLPSLTLRAQIATAASDNPHDIRRAARALIERVATYWECIDYCRPVISGASGELPRALPAPRYENTHNSLRQGLRVTDVGGPEQIWNEAMSMCLTTAFHVAQWELGSAIPEGQGVLAVGRIAALTACRSESITGSNWKRTSRHMGTTGARKLLARALAGLPQAWLVVHPDTATPFFYADAEYASRGGLLERRAIENNRPFVFSSPAAVAVAQAA